MNMSDKDNYNLGQSRYSEQKVRMQSLIDRGVCFLCIDNVENETGSPILLDFDHWYVKDNDFPYRGTDRSLLTVSKYHVASFDKLDEIAQKEYGIVIAETLKLLNFPDAYSIAMRNGDMNYTGSTVSHLHGHILVPDKKYADEPSLKVKLLNFPDYSPRD